MSSRFVLLRHECPAGFEKPSHWDFMLETEGVLATWELRVLPADWSKALNLESGSSASAVPAIRLADHRLAYLEYEGPLSGNRGSVNRMDCGTCELLENTLAQLVVELAGSILKGRFKLSQEDGSWLVGRP